MEELVAAGWVLKVLEGHCVMFVEPAGVKEPRGQQMTEPGALYWLAGQENVQAAWPVPGPYLPATQRRQAWLELRPVLGLNVPCAMARRCAEVKMVKREGAAGWEAKGRPRAGHANALPRKTGTRWRICCP